MREYLTQILFTRVAFILQSPLLLLSFSFSYFFSSSTYFLFVVTHMEPQLEEDNEQRLNGVDSLPEPDLTSTSSSLSSIFSADDFKSTTSSGDIFGTSGSSGEILTAEAAVPRTVEPLPFKARDKCVGRNNKGVTWGFTSVIGRRKEMEDAVAVIPVFMYNTCDHVGGCTAPGSITSAEILPINFFGVYDGHGGSQVAKFCAERMHGVIAEELDGEVVETSGSGWQKRWEMAFSSSFGRADSELVTAAVAPEMVGSTAVVAVLSGCQIITSNCGDSRAVLCRGTETVPLTVDQKPDREDELIRIEREGGRVINWNGARVLGVLAMSRAIGDRYLRPWIIPVPEVTFTTRTDDDECLILASDGLWDVVTNEEAGEVARRILRRRRRRSLSANDDHEVSPAQALAHNLTEIAIARNSSDNISIIVVDLKSRRKPMQLKINK